MNLRSFICRLSTFCIILHVFYALRVPSISIANKGHLTSQHSSILNFRSNTYRLHSSSTGITTDSSNVESTDVIDFSSQPKSFLSRITRSINLMYKFSRPHTIKGTILASLMGVTRALLENPGKLSLQLVPRALLGLIALLCGNAYIVGINQIYDVQIDEVNKPYLPIAAKSLSTQRAWQIVFACLFTGIAIVKSMFSPIIFNLYMTGVVLGTAYSVPPIQLKRVSYLAGSIIAFVRGFLLNFGVYYAVREALQVKFSWNPVVAFIASFMTVFASVIAVTKDLSDVEGDLKFNINTFAAKYGVQKIAGAASMVLSAAYAVAIALPFVMPKSFKVIPMTLGHSAILSYFIYSYFQLDSKNAVSVRKFYKSIWNAFYLEYMLYPLI